MPVSYLLAEVSKPGRRDEILANIFNNSVVNYNKIKSPSFLYHKINFYYIRNFKTNFRGELKGMKPLKLSKS